jgi:hypothetical protein
MTTCSGCWRLWPPLCLSPRRERTEPARRIELRPPNTVGHPDLQVDTNRDEANNPLERPDEFAPKGRRFHRGPTAELTKSARLRPPDRRRYQAPRRGRGPLTVSTARQRSRPWLPWTRPTEVPSFTPWRPPEASCRASRRPQRRRAAAGDRGLYDRCITRGLLADDAGDLRNAHEIVQTRRRLHSLHP